MISYPGETVTYLSYQDGKEVRIVIDYDDNGNATITRDALEDLLRGYSRPFFPEDA
jgi:hypothetical protein